MIKSQAQEYNKWKTKTSLARRRKNYFISMIRGFILKDDKTSFPITGLAAFDALSQAETQFLWVDIFGDLPAEAEALFSDNLGWHPIVIKNLRENSSRPKLINFDSYSQITLHALNLLAIHQKDESTIEIDIVISKNLLLTYHKFPVLGIDETLSQFESRKQEWGGADALFYQIISSLIEKYVPEVADKEGLVAALQQEALFDPKNELLERIVLMRDELIELGRALVPQQLIVAQMASGSCSYIGPFIRPYFRDAENQFRSLIDDVQSFKEVMTNSLELYRSAMSSKTNDVMKIFTAISTLLLPLTFITGLYGMNVHIPLADHPHMFNTILIICAGIFIGMLYYFRSRKWF